MKDEGRDEGRDGREERERGRDMGEGEEEGELHLLVFTEIFVRNRLDESLRQANNLNLLSSIGHCTKW